MKTKLKKLKKSKVELEIEVEEKEFEEIFEKVLFDLKKDLQVPGFRKGMVPRDIALRKIGQEKVLLEAANFALKEYYKRAILKENLEPISQPEILILKLAPKNPFFFRASFFVLPKIDLPDYKEIASKIKKRKIFVSEAEIDDVVSWLQKSRPKFKEVSRPAEEGDFVEIEYSSSEIENGKTQKDSFLLGKGHLIEGFEENLIKMEAGKKKSFSLHFPKKHFRKDLAGKMVNFEVKMNSVKEVEFPEITDDFAKSLGNFEDLDALRKSIREGLKLEKELAESQRVREEILEKIEKECFFEIPEILVKLEKERVLDDFKKRVLKNSDFKEYLKRVKKTEKEFSESLEKIAQKKVKRFLILREVSIREKIEARDEEIKEEINKILKNYPDLERTKKEIDLERLKSYTKEEIRTEKTLIFLEGLAQH